MLRTMTPATIAIASLAMPSSRIGAPASVNWAPAFTLPAVRACRSWAIFSSTGARASLRFAGVLFMSQASRPFVLATSLRAQAHFILWV